MGDVDVLGFSIAPCQGLTPAANEGLGVLLPVPPQTSSWFESAVAGRTNAQQSMKQHGWNISWVLPCGRCHR